MNHDLVLEGKAYVNNAFQHCCIGIDEGKITEIKKILKGDRTKRFSKQLILPAGVDVHVHFRDPGMKQKETFTTGSIAAAYGGITSVFDMPNTHPPTTTMSRLQEKIDYAERSSFVDFGIYAGVTTDNLSKLVKLSKLCSGYKVFLGETTESFAFSISQLSDLFQRLQGINKPIFFHAEDNDCLQKHKRKEHTLSHHHHCRPPACEVAAIKQILAAATDTNQRIHICHISSAPGLECLKSKNNTFSCGVTPHHLLLSIEHITQPEVFYKVNPPIRPHTHASQLFTALKQGTIDILESDHAPHTLEEKKRDFMDVPSGIPGVETMIPLFLSLAKQQKISFPRLISLCCERPADLLHLPKGKIHSGNDADLMIIDLRQQTRINAETLHSKAQWSPFEGFNAIFPTHVFLRGHHLIDTGDMNNSLRIGHHVHSA